MICGTDCTHLFADDNVCDKCQYVCSHYNSVENDVCNVCGTYVYKITHQPTTDEPYVALNDSNGASYQWYEAEVLTTPITDENAEPFVRHNENTTYDEEMGWTGIHNGSEFYEDRSFFVVDLEAGESIVAEFSSEVYYMISIGNVDTGERHDLELDEPTTKVAITAEVAGTYDLSAFTEDEDIIVKAVIQKINYTPIENQNTATLLSDINGVYACEVTFPDGTSEMSDYFNFEANQSDAFKPSLNAQTNADGSQIRFVTSVDSLRYREVGFVITNANNKEQTITRSSTKVYFAIMADGKSLTAKEITGNEDMNYILTFTVTGLENAQNPAFEVTLYVVNLDGTKTYGNTEIYVVADMLA